MSKRRERALKRKERDKPKFTEDVRLSSRGRVIVYVVAAIFLIVGALMAFGIFP